MEGGDRVVVIDFGGQYAHLIARRVRELGRLSVIIPASSGLRDIVREASSSRAVILSGGPASVWETDHEVVAKELLKLGVPILGVCYGHQLLAKAMGGRVDRSPRPEFGPTQVRIVDSRSILRGLPGNVTVWMSHNDAVIEAPPGSRVLAVSEGSPVAAFEAGGRVFGVQWHPEVAHSEYGLEVLSNFLDIARVSRTWVMRDVLPRLIEDTRRAIGGRRAIAAVSGGIDSTVAAIIASKAVGRALHAVLIDHGLHPHGEVERAVEALGSVGLEVRVVDASREFLEALRGLTDPEEKRRAFGAVYGRVLRRVAEEVGAEVLVQGTIYPDVIESGSRPGSDVIKTHHNVGGLPRDLGLEVVEPLRMLYKDEVREIAGLLGLPRHFIEKQPVPGPGLAVRIEGEVTEDKLRIVRKADLIVREEVESHGLAGSLWQYFAILSSSKATGVKGDRRAYGWVVVVRMVESRDAMTARIARPPWPLLERIASRITSEIPEVVRVVYDITSKPPATIEWE